MLKVSKLSKTILTSVSIRVFAVILVSSVLSYIHLYRTIEDGIKETLQKYVSERAKREDSLFSLAQRNHEILKAEAKRRFALKPFQGELARFDRLLRRLPDGTIRNKKELYDGSQAAGVFIPAGINITDELKHRVLVMIDLAETYGKAFRSRFQDTYFTTPENIMILYWPEVPNWTLEMKSDFDMSKEEYVWVADKAHNPLRKSVWTGLFYDKVGKTWMASLETPLDTNGSTVTIGHDVMLDELVGRVSSEHLQGTYNIIFRSDGNLIAHPQLLSAIKQNEGKLDLQTTSDHFLKEAFHTVKILPVLNNNESQIVEHSDGKNLLAFSKIEGPGWYFLTVFPHSLITTTALSGIIFVVLLALASLGIEVAFLYFGLKREVIEPLSELERSVARISRGEYLIRVEVNRTDEIGQLAESFNQMGQQIYDNEKSLQQKVDERTRESDEQRVALVQQSKMSALGEMAAGIAHEINNPLTIIASTSTFLKKLIQKGKYDPIIAEKCLSDIEKTITRITKIIQALKTVSRDTSDEEFVSVILRDIMDDVCGLCSEKFKNHGVKFMIDLSDPIYDHVIECRRIQISQIFINLLGNAYDAIEDLPERWIQIECKNLMDNIEFRITDSGPGIPKEIQEKIFQPFFTTKPIGKGTGLGLSLSISIVKDHKGTFNIDEENPNTCFVISLPIIRKAA